MGGEVSRTNNKRKSKSARALTPLYIPYTQISTALHTAAMCTRSHSHAHAYVHVHICAQVLQISSLLVTVSLTDTVNQMSRNEQRFDDMNKNMHMRTCIMIKHMRHGRLSSDFLSRYHAGSDAVSRVRSTAL